MSKKYISTLEYYNYGENNKMDSAKGPSYKVKISDKEGNIITLEKDDSLYACVKLDFNNNTGVLRLLDVAHEDSVLAEIEMPNADYIYNCRFDEESNAILFDVKSLYGDETHTIELNVDDLVELYEAGKGIEIGEKNEQTGRKPISIKLAEGEDLLKLTDSGLGLDSKVITEEELAEAISGKADTSYVEDLISSVSGATEEEIEKIFSILGTDDDDPNISDRIDAKADIEDLTDLDEKVGEIEISVADLSGNVSTILEDIDSINIKVNGISEDIENLKTDVADISGDVATNTANIDLLEQAIDDNKVFIEKVEDGLPDTIREAYILKNNLGEQLGERINIYNDSSIESIEYDGQYLIITYIKSTGEREVVRIDLDVVRPEYGDGLQEDNNVVSVKIDIESDDYLSVSSDGVKLSGIKDKFNQLDEQLETEKTARENADNNLQDAINAVQYNVDAEAEERRNADSELSNAIDAERNRAIARENEIVDEINSSVAEERERAEHAEALLRESIDNEVSRATSKESQLEANIVSETEERTSEDAQIRRLISDTFSGIDGRINEVASDLAEETAERESEDAEILREIGTFRDLYAKKEYVDSKDVEWAVSATTSAITLANQYSDLKNDYLEAELKLYCDSGNTELREAISENATKINVISNLKGVSGSDASNYDDTGNGILDVLHKEFHAFTGTTAPIARGAQIRNADEVALGRYNISNKETDPLTGVDVPSGCTIFSIGIGTSDDLRRNALEVRQDGNVYMWVEGEYMNVNRLLAMLAHEVYDADSTNGNNNNFYDGN